MAAISWTQYSGRVLLYLPPSLVLGKEQWKDFNEFRFQKNQSKATSIWCIHQMEQQQPWLSVLNTDLSGGVAIVSQTTCGSRMSKRERRSNSSVSVRNGYREIYRQTHKVADFYSQDRLVSRGHFHFSSTPKKFSLFSESLLCVRKKKIFLLLCEETTLFLAEWFKRHDFFLFS